jgi:hypothetical protein
MNAFYGTTILAGEQVKIGVSDSLFLIDVVRYTASAGHRTTKVYELVPAAFVSRSNFDGEWMYSFATTETTTMAVCRQKEWEQCINAFFIGNYGDACLRLTEYISRYSTLRLSGFAQQMLEISKHEVVKIRKRNNETTIIDYDNSLSPPPPPQLSSSSLPLLSISDVDDEKSIIGKDRDDDDDFTTIMSMTYVHIVSDKLQFLYENSTQQISLAGAITSKMLEQVESLPDILD